MTPPHPPPPLPRLPISRADLVFIQNGMLQPWLDSRGLGDNTQVCHAMKTAVG